MNSKQHAEGWTQERADMAMRLWENGASASKIAAALGGGVTRNGVIGKLSRMNAPARDVSVMRKRSLNNLPLRPTRVTNNQKTVRRKRGHGLEGTTVHRLRELHAAMATAPKIIPEPMPKDPPPLTTPITFDELESHSCRYPFGSEHPYVFCGAPRTEDSSYCEDHKALCYKGQPKVASTITPFFQLRSAAA